MRQLAVRRTFLTVVLSAVLVAGTGCPDSPPPETPTPPGKATGQSALPVVLVPAAAETGRVSFRHPAWGQVALVTSLDEGTHVGHIQVFDADGKVRWDYETGRDLAFCEMVVNSPAIDKTGNVFIDWDPGRARGVSVLRPTKQGFDDLGTLPSLAEYAARFSYADVVDVDGDGTFEIKANENNCEPSCADAEITSTMYAWDGTRYAAQ
jgi:hypothetical protein